MLNLYLLLFFLIGLILGSFLNCLIWRLHKEESILGRSYCPKCRKKIVWYDNIPLLSFILLKTKCRNCKKKISWQYPLVELITALLFAFSFYHFFLSGGETPLLLVRNLVLIFGLTLIFVYDLRFQLVPMLFVLPLLALVFIINIFLGFSLLNILIAGLIGASFFGLQFILTKGKAIGEGDIWLGALMGIILVRLDMLVLALMLSYFIGATVGIILLITSKKKYKSKIALGPFLALGTLISLFFGNIIINWYLNLF